MKSNLIYATIAATLTLLGGSAALGIPAAMPCLSSSEYNGLTGQIIRMWSEEQLFAAVPAAAPTAKTATESAPTAASSTTAASKSRDAIEMEQFVQQIIKQITTIINNNQATKEEKVSQLRKFLRGLVDIEWMAKFALGRQWNSLSPEKQREYVDTYYDYLIDSYVPNFLKYTGHEITLVSIKPAQQEQYIILTKIISPANRNLEIFVSYRCKKYEIGDNRQIKVRDIIGEGISLISTQRSEFSSLIRQGGVDLVIDSLQKAVHSSAGGSITAGTQR